MNFGKSYLRNCLLIVTTLILPILLLSVAQARDFKDSIIYGSDYDFFTLSRNEKWTACRNECKADPHCKAWSYIRSKRQCRLKAAVGRRSENNCCVSGVISKRQSNRSGQAAGRIAGVYLNARYKNRGICIKMKPKITAGRGWACIWNDRKSNHDELMTRVLMSGYENKRKCSVSWSKIQSGYPKIDVASCY